MPYVNCNDVRIFYEEFGKGEPVLFLHSHFSRGLLAFSGQILPFSGQYHCFFPDFRGHGRSISDSLQWNSRQIAEDMALFLGELHLPSAHLIGYSCGAYVGCYMAATHPEKVKSLVTIGGAAYPRPDGADSFLPENLNDTDFCEDMRLRHMDAHRGDWQTYLRMTVTDWKSHPQLSENEWRAIRCPALFINGENDSFGTCAELQAKVPHGKTYEVKGGTHRPHFVGQQVDEVNQLILDFLNRLEK